MLDLSRYKKFDVRLPDGTILAIDQPTPQLIMEMNDVSYLQGESKEVVYRWLVSLSTMILNNNQEQRGYNEYYVRSQLNFDMMMALLEGYAQFIADDPGI